MFPQHAGEKETVKIKIHLNKRNLNYFIIIRVIMEVIKLGKAANTVEKLSQIKKQDAEKNKQ